MGFQHVEFMPFGESFFTTFLKTCGRGESLGTTTCPKTVVWVSKGMLPVKYACSNKASFVTVKFYGYHMTATEMRYNQATLNIDDMTEFKMVVSIYIFTPMQYPI